MKALGIGIGIIAVLLGLNIVHLRGVGRALDESWEPKTVDYGAQLKSIAPGAMAAASLGKACRTDHNLVRQGGARGSLDDNHWINRDFQALGHLAAYVQCIASHELQRLCDRSERQRLAADYDLYLRLRRDVADQARIMEAEAGASAPYMRIQRDLSGGARNAPSYSKAIASVDEQLTQTFVDLADAGYVSARDFSGQLAKRLAQVKPRDSACN